MKNNIRKTERGFGVIRFDDVYDEPCSIQESSKMGDGDEPGATYLWVGADTNRMHLSRDHARMLVDVLSTWVETGNLRLP